MKKHYSAMEIINLVKPYLVLTIVPLLFTLVFAGAMSPVSNKDVPVLIYDMDNSTQSRMVVDYFENYPYISVSESVDSVDEIKNAMLSGDAKGAFIFPEGFGDALESKAGAEMLVFEDATNFMNLNVVLQAASNVSSTVNGGIQIKLLEAGGIVPYEAEKYVYTMNVVDRGLYNPTYGYLYFLFPALLAIFVQQTFLAATTPYLIEQKRDLKLGASRKYVIRKIAAKIISFILFDTLGLMMCIMTLNKYFNYPVSGDISLLMIIHFVYMLAITGMAFVIASLFDDSTHCSQFNMFLTIPTLLSCGYAWPEYMMPEAFKAVVTKIWPLYYYANPMKDIIMKGATYDMEIHYAEGCAVFAAVWIPIGIALYTYKVRVIKKWEQENNIIEPDTQDEVILLEPQSK